MGSVRKAATAALLIVSKYKCAFFTASQCGVTLFCFVLNKMALAEELLGNKGMVVHGGT